MKKRCVLVVPDAGPFNSLWVAGHLDLLLALDMSIVVVDAVYDELTGEPVHYDKDRDVKEFIDGNPEVFHIEETDTGIAQRERRAAGRPPKRNAGEVAMTDFMTDGLERYAASGEPVLVLFEDQDIRKIHFLRKPPHVHLLSTVALLHGMERIGRVTSAKQIIDVMTGPDNPAQARRFTDLPDGIDEPADIGSTWQP